MEKENLKQDLNELDQLKELLRTMQATNGSQKNLNVNNQISQTQNPDQNPNPMKQETEDFLTISDNNAIQKKAAVPLSGTKHKTSNHVSKETPGQDLQKDDSIPATAFMGYTADNEYDNNWLVESRGQSSHDL